MEPCLYPAEAPDFQSILTPAQRAASDELLGGLGCGDLVVLQGDVGLGKTTVLRSVQSKAGGVFLSVREFMQALDRRQPFAIEEAWTQLMEAALEKHDLIFLDDLHLIAAAVGGYSYPRANLLDVAITAVLEHKAKTKSLVVAVEEEAPEQIKRRAQIFKIAEFTCEDYQQSAPVIWGLAPMAWTIHEFIVLPRR
jgi:hypothetical protein